MRRPADLTGLKFGRLTAIRLAIAPNKKECCWECVCDCGTSKVVTAACLRTGKSKSCGCLRREMMREEAKTRNLRHGEGRNGKESPEYRAWAAMLSRCNNVNHKSFRDYGARGITVCERWVVYENFLADMGRRPSDRHSIDRIDNNAGYSPGNCRWATSEVQNNNQRRKTHETKTGKHTLFEHAGRTQSVLAWCQELDMNFRTYRARRTAGMTIQEALLTPLLKLGRKPRA